MRLFSNAKRPVHLGPYPLERLPRADTEPTAGTASLPPVPDSALAPSIAPYKQLFASLRDGEVAPLADPLTEDPVERANNLKAGIYFLDADQAGVGPVPDKAWIGSPLPGHCTAIVILVAHPPEPAAGEPGQEDLRQAAADIAALRAAEIAVITAGYVRQIGFAARAHVDGACDVDLLALALTCGLVTVEDGKPVAPHVGNGFQLAAVTTGFEAAHDRPLGPAAMAASRGASAFFGIGGIRPGWKRLDGRHRPLHLGRYPMEKIARRETPTTHISEHVPRMPKRASFFTRALHGDLGVKPKAEHARFAIKTPSSFSYTPLIRAMVPLQTGETAQSQSPGSDNAAANADAMKALAHALGGDMIGICTIPDYAWYSHHDDGSEIAPYHRNAIVILIDQGFETMEGASGDDWISGAQSMRAYMRGAEIAGVIADHIRRKGWAARSHTNFDSDLLHIPLVLQAGLGELSRIGELPRPGGRTPPR